MIEDNQAAEMLNDRLNNVEAFYDRMLSGYEVKHKWKIRVQDMLTEFNNLHLVAGHQIKHHKFETRFVDTRDGGCIIFRLGNSFNFFEKRYQYHDLQQCNMDSLEEDFYEFVFKMICLSGLSSEFTKSGIAAKQKYLYGEETNHVTHA